MSDAAPPPISDTGCTSKRLRLLFVRAVIVALTFAVVLLLWRPYKLDDCLVCASRNGHSLMVRYYLLRAQPVNQRGSGGSTAAMKAAWNGHLEILELLVRHGADLNLVDDQGDTALIWAASGGRDDVVAYLLRKGVPLNQQNAKGNTAIFYAIRNRNASTVRLLLNAGADLNLQNKDGETVLQLAERAGYDAMVTLLRRHGAKQTDLSTGSSPYPTAPLSPPRLWALATAALLVQHNGDSHELLGSRPSSDRIWAQNGLRDWWGIANRQEAIEILDRLTKEGHRTRFLAEDRPAHRKQPPVPYLAWDYCRLVWVAGVSYIAGYLSEDEAWERIMPAARAIQVNYSSWDEMGEDYLRGRQHWNGSRDPTFDRVFQLLTKADDPTSPWNKNPWNTDLTDHDSGSSSKGQASVR